MKELQRLAALHDSGLLDQPNDPFFDRITRLAANALGAEIALVSLVDADRQWFKSAHGLAVRETPRAHSFCAHAIEQEGIMVVPDARQDPRFMTNPLVTGEPEIAFYAGAPLVTSDGHALGTLCVIDRSPRAVFDGTSRQILLDLAASVMDEVERVRRDRHAERLQIVADELQHRMGNIYALVGSLVSRLDKTEIDKDVFVRRLREKISALARAQALLSASQWRQVSLAELAEAVLAPLCVEAARRRYSIQQGDDLALSPHGAFIVTLMLGELAANAAKHGALRGGAGTASLSWRADGPDVVIEWREQGGEPALAATQSEGFGSKILRQIVPLDVKGSATWTLDAEGFHYALEARRDRLCVESRRAAE